MDYSQAAKIRKKSFGTLLAEQEGGLGASLKSTISQKTQARVEGIKETFDPMNIAKKMTFGSNWAPAMLGKLTGRKAESIAHFTGAKLKRKKGGLGATANSIDDNEEDSNVTSTAIKSVQSIYRVVKEKQDFLKKSNKDDDKFDKKNKKEEILRHNELVKAVSLRRGFVKPQERDEKGRFKKSEESTKETPQKPAPTPKKTTPGKKPTETKKETPASKKEEVKKEAPAPKKEEVKKDTKKTSKEGEKQQKDTKAKQDKERADKQKADKERADKDKADKDKADKDKADKDKAEKDKAARDKDKADKDKANKDKADKEKTDREAKDAKDKADKETATRQKKEEKKPEPVKKEPEKIPKKEEPAPKPSAEKPSAPKPTAGKIPTGLTGRAAQVALGLGSLGITSKAAIAAIVTTSAKESGLDPFKPEDGAKAWLNTLNGKPKVVNGKTLSPLEYIYTKFPQLGPGGRVAKQLNMPNGVPEDYIRGAMAKGDEAWFTLVYPGGADAYKYRGRGLIQITGKDVYKAVGDIIGIDLVKDPDAIIKDFDTAAKATGAYLMNSIGRGNSKKGLEELNKLKDDKEALKLVIANVASGGAGYDKDKIDKMFDPNTKMGKTTASQLEAAGKYTQLGLDAASGTQIDQASQQNTQMRSELNNQSGGSTTLNNTTINGQTLPTRPGQRRDDSSPMDAAQRR